MRGSAAAILILVFLIVPCIIVVKPAFSSVGVTENTWVSKAQMQQARYGLGVGVVNGKIYAIGGYAKNGVVGTNEEYDPKTDTWTYKTSMPTPMAEFATAVYQNKIYCIRESVNQVYDPATDTWTAKEAMPIDAGGASAVFDNKIYVIGGFFDEQAVNFKTVTQIYDPETDEWSLCKPPTTFVVYGFAEATIGVMAPKRIYFFGWPYGDSAGMPDDPFYTNQVYDPEKDSWVAGAGIPTSRCMFGAAVVNDLLYVIGGFTETFDMFWNSDVTLYAANEQYTPFGYGTPDPSYDDVAPEISVVSPETKNYYTADARLNFTDVGLNFRVDEPVFSVHYVVDGGSPVEISGNTTLSGLAVGAHNVSVFGFDASGNMGTSETVCFAVAAPEPFPVVPVAAASAASVVVAVAGLLVYFRKRNRQAGVSTGSAL